MNQDELRTKLERKLEILNQISTNDETQSRFVHKREMRGLRRLLTERGELLRDLKIVNQELDDAGEWQSVSGLETLREALANKQRDVLEHARRVIREAENEKEQIGTELGTLRTRRRAAKKYAVPAPTQAQGKRINAKG